MGDDRVWALGSCAARRTRWQQIPVADVVGQTLIRQLRTEAPPTRRKGCGPTGCGSSASRAVTQSTNASNGSGAGRARTPGVWSPATPPRETFSWPRTNQQSNLSESAEPRIMSHVVRGHEKVPTGGQVEVSTGGQITGPTTRVQIRFGELAEHRMVHGTERLSSSTLPISRASFPNAYWRRAALARRGRQTRIAQRESRRRPTPHTRGR
jgi:hypothetical protein